MLLIAEGITQTPLPRGSGGGLRGTQLNYQVNTRGAACDLFVFLFHSPAPPSAAHSGSCGQGWTCFNSAISEPRKKKSARPVWLENTRV